MVGRYHGISGMTCVCAVARIGNASGRCGIDQRPMTVYVVGVGAGDDQRSQGRVALSKVKNR